jgi:hypothetical protein
MSLFLRFIGFLFCVLFAFAINRGIKNYRLPTEKEDPDAVTGILYLNFAGGRQVYPITTIEFTAVDKTIGGRRIEIYEYAIANPEETDSDEEVLKLKIAGTFTPAPGNDLEITRLNLEALTGQIMPVKKSSEEDYDDFDDESEDSDYLLLQLPDIDETGDVLSGDFIIANVSEPLDIGDTRYWDIDGRIRLVVTIPGGKTNQIRGRFEARARCTQEE